MDAALLRAMTEEALSCPSEACCELHAWLYKRARERRGEFVGALGADVLPGSRIRGDGF